MIEAPSALPPLKEITHAAVNELPTLEALELALRYTVSKYLTGGVVTRRGLQAIAQECCTYNGFPTVRVGVHTLYDGWRLVAMRPHPSFAVVAIYVIPGASIPLCLSHHARPCEICEEARSPMYVQASNDPRRPLNPGDTSVAANPHWRKIALREEKPPMKKATSIARRPWYIRILNAFCVVVDRIFGARLNR